MTRRPVRREKVLHQHPFGVIGRQLFAPRFGGDGQRRVVGWDLVEQPAVILFHRAASRFPVSALTIPPGRSRALRCQVPLPGADLLVWVRGRLAFVVVDVSYSLAVLSRFEKHVHLRVPTVFFPHS